LAERFILIYVFLCLALGLTCLGVTLVLVTRRGDAVSRSFLAFYAALTLMVTSALLLAYSDTLPDPAAPSTQFWLEYLDAIVGFYSVMFTLPYFAHRVFAVRDPRRDRWLLAITLAAFAAQHVTELALAGTVWDDRGDVAENALIAAVVAYTCWLAVSRLNAPGVNRALAVRFTTLLVIAVPSTAYDLFAGDDSPLRFYPLWYCVLSVVITWTLVQIQAPARGPSIPASWALTRREGEVTHLVQGGLSNKEIARKLGISVNTVKSHLRSIFEKSQATSRFDLISRLVTRPDDLGLTGSDAPRDHPKG